MGQFRHYLNVGDFSDLSIKCSYFYIEKKTIYTQVYVGTYIFGRGLKIWVRVLLPRFQTLTLSEDSILKNHTFSGDSIVKKHTLSADSIKRKHNLKGTVSWKGIPLVGILLWKKPYSYWGQWGMFIKEQMHILLVSQITIRQFGKYLLILMMYVELW